MVCGLKPYEHGYWIYYLSGERVIYGMKIKQVSKMTPEQWAKVPAYYEKWYRNGLRTDPLDRVKAIADVEWIYAEILEKEEKPSVIFVQSPIQAILTAVLLKDLKCGKLQNLRQNLRQNLEQNLRQNLGQSLWQNLSQNLRQNLWLNLEQSLWQNLGQNLWQNLWQNLEQSLWHNLWLNLEQNLRQNLEQNLRQNLGQSLWQNLSQNLRQNDNEWIRNHWNDWYPQNWWVGWIAFYEFCLLELFPSHVSEFSKFTSFIEHWKDLHVIYPYEGICFVVERPLEIHLNATKQLHKDIAPALLYRDGYCLWALNGVQVSRQIVETPASELSCELILKEKNAEIRREIVRKIGVERVYKDLGATVLDTFDGYELISLMLGDDRVRPFLKMVNPSIGTIHIEGVHPDCKTVKDAITWRNGLKTYEKPAQLT